MPEIGSISSPSPHGTAYALHAAAIAVDIMKAHRICDTYRMSHVCVLGQYVVQTHADDRSFEASASEHIVYVVYAPPPSSRFHWKCAFVCIAINVQNDAFKRNLRNVHCGLGFSSICKYQICMPIYHSTRYASYEPNTNARRAIYCNAATVKHSTWEWAHVSHVITQRLMSLLLSLRKHKGFSASVQHIRLNVCPPPRFKRAVVVC